MASTYQPYLLNNIMLLNVEMEFREYSFLVLKNITLFIYNASFY